MDNEKLSWWDKKELYFRGMAKKDIPADKRANLVLLKSILDQTYEEGFQAGFKAGLKYNS